MHHNSSKNKEIARLAVIYTVMVAAVFLILAFIVMFVMGYRFDSDKGQIEQYGLFQFSSSPSGATVSVDGKIVSSSTPNKQSVEAGTHKIVMWRDGYQSWNKTLDIKAGTLVWLNYALLVPKKLTVEPVSNYVSIASSLSSPKGHYILVQPIPTDPSVDLIDISSDVIKTTKLAIPATVYSESATVGMNHNFQITKWDDGERYLLVKHTYADKFEWLVVDTQDANLSKNISLISNLPIDDIRFFGTNGRMFYALSNAELRKIDVSKSIVSEPFATGVSKFDVYNKSNVVTYISTDSIDKTKTVVGVYRDGDDRAYVVKTLTASSAPVSVAATHYFNVDYVAISEGTRVDILGGSYPSVDRDSATSLKPITSFNLDYNAEKLSFSPIGQYVFVQSGSNFASYDLEYQKLANSKFPTTSDSVSMKWIDDNYIWSDDSGKLTVREFDGQNMHEINAVQSGQDAVLTHNGRFMYSINKNATGFQLQRVRMILP